jgi:hypothetical protein
MTVFCLLLLLLFCCLHDVGGGVLKVLTASDIKMYDSVFVFVRNQTLFVIVLTRIIKIGIMNYFNLHRLHRNIIMIQQHWNWF